MYTPDEFILSDTAAIHAAMAANPLAAFATNSEDGPVVTHLPLVARDEGDDLVLYGHFARANPHWKALGTAHAVAVFSGPQGYITPSWYETKRATGKVVPTWNYVTVHVRGTPELLPQGDPTRIAVELLTDSMETPRETPWKVADAPERFTETMLRGIVAFRMVATRINATAKLSQNKGEADFNGARNGLAADGATALSQAMRALAE